MPDAGPDDAVALAAETIGDLMTFWGFKRSMGLIWTELYLRRRPLSQEDLARACGLSAGMVSQTLAELEGWGVVHRQIVGRERRRLYTAETDVRAMVVRVLSRRELHLVRGAIARLEQAAATLRRPAAGAAAAEKAESILMAQRADGLVELARVGEGMVEQLVRVGQIDLGPLQDLARRS